MFLIDCRDPWARRITLTQDQWQGHILAKHPELAPFLAAVEATLVDPTRVMSDTNTAERQNFYRENALPAPFDHLYLKVCVEFHQAASGEPATGRVITAYPITAVKRGEVQRWP